METSKMKAVLIDKETGKRIELPGAVGTIEMNDFEPQEQPSGLKSYEAKVTAKVRVNRKTRKWLQRLFMPPRPPKYIPKDRIARTILSEDPNNTKTYDELMKLSHRELSHRIWPCLLRIISKLPEIGRPQHNFPSGGIVCPNFEPVNGGELIVPPAMADKLRKELEPKPEQMERVAIEWSEVKRMICHEE